MANGNKVIAYLIVTISIYSAGEDFTGSQIVVNELGSDPDSPDSATLETWASLIKLKEAVN
jgi:hypothetical protein